MIVEYDTSGKIIQVVFDPVPDGYNEFMTKKSKTFLDIKPKKLDEKVLVDFDENNNPRYAEQIETPQIDVNTQYVDVNSLTLANRPNFDVPKTITLNVKNNEEYIIKDLPPGTTITFDGAINEVKDGKIELKAVDMGAFSFALNCWPYLTANIEVICQ